MLTKHNFIVAVDPGKMERQTFSRTGRVGWKRPKLFYVVLTEFIFLKIPADSFILQKSRLTQCVPEGVSSGVKRPGPEADNSRSSSAEIKNERTCNSTPPTRLQCVCVRKALPPPSPNFFSPTEFLNSKHCILDVQNELRMFFRMDGCMPKDYVCLWYANHRLSTFHWLPYYCN